jgi:carboxyl-terminal processing protease
VPAGPADKSGLIKMGDLVLGVAQGKDGEMEDVEGMKLQRIVEKIRGEANTVVRLKIQPADDPTITREISIVREKVQMKDTLAKGELIEYSDPSKPGAAVQRMGWITLDSFYADMENRGGNARSATGDVKIVLDRLTKEGISGLVIDLRGNGGGSLEEAIKLTGLFVKKGTPVVQQKDESERCEARGTRDHPVYEGPLTVLTDTTSASASEIFAAALQDCGRAVIAGDHSTFGKGTVQTIYDVREQMPPFVEKGRAGSLKVTIAKFYRILGGSTQRQGVTPDVILPSRYDAMQAGERHLKYPLPYDTIPALTFDMASTHPLPLKDLRTRSAARVEADPDMGFIRDYVQRTKKMLDDNILSLNEKKRVEEDAASEARNKAYKEARRKRVAETNKNGDPYKVFPVTLENASEAQLKPDSEVKKEKPLTASLDDEEASTDSDEEDLFPHGFDPAKLETLQITRDLVELTARNKATVKRD